MKEKNDEQLVGDFIGGDEKVLAILVLKYLKPIFNFVYRYVDDQAISEDITQEVFVKVWKKIRKFDQTKKFKTWIISIAKNTTIDYLRKKHISIPLSHFIDDDEGNVIEETVSGSAPWPDEIFYRKDLADKLAFIMKNLSPLARQVVYLHHTEELTFQEIADILNESIDTLKSRYRRALIHLREQFDYKDFG